MDIKNKKKKFINFIIAIVSILIVIVICTFLLDTSGKINQGNYRISDLVVSSTAVVEDTKVETEAPAITTETVEPVETPISSLSDLRLDVSQKNEISILIAKTTDAEIGEVYIDNIKINYPKATENMYIYEKEENKIDLKTQNVKIVLNKEDKDGQYLVKLNVDNVNCIKEAVIPETETSIVFDGTIFNILNIKISDIVFDIQFNLNITDSKGKINICKIKLYIPNELLVTNGISITKEDAGKFPFRIK